MNKRTDSEINRSGLPTRFLSQEQEKSNLVVEANLLKAQSRYEAAAEKFAAAAEIEESLAAQLGKLDRPGKRFIHQFSAISCWAQAGDLHRALSLGDRLLQTNDLTEHQRQRVADYLELLHRRRIDWIRQWAPEPTGAAS